jgi:ubiquitin carboxyl-terminal hydrolase 8
MERQKYDLVVFYDESSRTVPTKGQFPTAISVLFRVLYENEYSKTLKRSPVLLTGGYVAWKQMLKDKEARRAGQVQGQASSSRPYNPKTMANGASSNVIG